MLLISVLVSVIALTNRYVTSILSGGIKDRKKRHLYAANRVLIFYYYYILLLITKRIIQLPRTTFKEQLYFRIYFQTSQGLPSNIDLCYANFNPRLFRGMAYNLWFKNIWKLKMAMYFKTYPVPLHSTRHY